MNNRNQIQIQIHSRFLDLNMDENVFEEGDNFVSVWLIEDDRMKGKPIYSVI